MLGKVIVLVTKASYRKKEKKKYESMIIVVGNMTVTIGNFMIFTEK